MPNAAVDTVLVVDDDEILRTLLGLLLESAGIASICVPSVEEAQTALAEQGKRVQAILLDLNLEGFRGEDFLEHIATNFPDKSVFVISGCLSEEIEERIGDRTIDGIITKPFQADELIETIKIGVEKRQQLYASGERA